MFTTEQNGVILYTFIYDINALSKTVLEHYKITPA
jgi:hypothetical protein